MLDTVELIMQSRGLYYLLGVAVVTLVVFTTAARHPTPQCPKCREVNRPSAKFCAHCGTPIKSS